MRSSRRKIKRKIIFIFCCLFESDLWLAYIPVKVKSGIVSFGFWKLPFTIYHMLLFVIWLIWMRSYLRLYWFGIAFGEHWMFCIWPMQSSKPIFTVIVKSLSIEHLLRESFHDPHHMYRASSTKPEQRKNFKCSFVSKPSRLIKYRPSFYSLVSCFWPVPHSFMNDHPNGLYSNCKLRIQLPVARWNLCQ